MSAETHQILTISTGHIREAEADALDSTDRTGTLCGNYGWLTWLPDEGPLLARQSAGLRAVIKLARELKCRYVMFDRDGPMVSGIPHYEW
jgi:hypothetical protein